MGESNNTNSKEALEKPKQSTSRQAQEKSIKFKDDMDELDNQQDEQNDNNNSSCSNTNNNNDNDKDDNPDDTATESCEDDYYSDDDDYCSSSSENNNDDEHSQYSYQDNDERGRPLPMPPLKYARIMGALPRGDNAKNSTSSSSSSSPATTLSLKITSSAMGRIVWRPSSSSSLDAVVNDESAMLSGSRHGGGGGGGGKYDSSAAAANNMPEWDEFDDNEEADRSSTRVYHVLALGFEDGTVRLFDALSGGSVLFGSSSDDSGAWFVNPNAAKQRRINNTTNNTNYTNNDHSQIVALSFDSNSSYLSAVNADGDAAIFGPLIWGRQSRRVQSSAAGAANNGNGTNGDGSQHKLSSFLSSFAAGGGGANNAASLQGEGGQSSSNNGVVGGKSRALRPPFALVKPPTSTIRFTYVSPQKESMGSSLRLDGGTASDRKCCPTCMALDPSYSRRKERALIVGFDDGRLVLSKLQVGGVAAGIGSGFTSLFGGGSNAASSASNVKKVDAVLYQGMGASSSSYGGGDQNGIEVITWRGGLIAWADSSGVKIFDIEAMSRIAHIDRPSGARCNLYPTISSLRPSIIFERSDSLLIGWGDCLMAMRIRELSTSSASTSKSNKDDSLSKQPKKKAVECTMAWELDCVACGLTPMDDKHVAVLGLLPSPLHSSSSMDDDGEVDESFLTGGDNILELQIINRVDGKSISSDKLPLLEQSNSLVTRKGGGIATANALEFSLLSSFAVPRMDDIAEWEALDDTEKESMRNKLSTGSSKIPPGGTNDKFLDMHLRWNMDRDVCTTGFAQNNDNGSPVKETTESDDDNSIGSNCSICSDDYVFALSAPIEDIVSHPTTPLKSSPPTMVVLRSHDLCLVQTRDIDDVVSYSRSLGKPALALKQGLAHQREIRRHGLDHLVDEYFISLLRIGGSKIATTPRTKRALSFSRLKIAARTLPILLGGDTRMWQRWIFMFARIPGGLFLIREKIPVRDPALPAFVFEMALEKMLEETCSNFVEEGNEDNNVPQPLGGKMADLFLETLRSWGNTSALRKRIQYHRYCTQSQRWNMQWQSVSGNQAVAPFVQQAGRDLNRRISQTALGCLSGTQFSPSLMQNTNIRQHVDSSRDSLFDVEHLIFRISALLHQSDANGRENSVEIDESSSSVTLGNIGVKASVVIEAMAELELMRERFDRALGYYLSIGSHFTSDSLSLLEELAVGSVNSFRQSSGNAFTAVSEKHLQNEAKTEKYEHVLSLIEIHQLYHLLLKKNYHFENRDGKDDLDTPIISLIMLVGLTRAGKFLMESCSPPEDTSVDAKEGTLQTKKGTAYSGANLPLDLVAEQLKSRPKLLYWFLFQVFIHKPDIYVKFPTTAVPPLAITDLHRIQFSLFVDYANERGNKINADSPAFMAVDEETPFMAFLKAALPHGGAQPNNVRQMLEARRGGRIDSPVFARELAFVIEKFGRGTADDAKTILDLYLRGTNNLYLAVSFAERNISHSSALWEMLVEYCTATNSPSDAEEKGHGALFGSLLEAAAHCGADLASLVSKIPTGMAIEGLRPKLVAAVTDYRHKVKIHEHVAKIQTDDKIAVLRELSHLTRRGARISRMPSSQGENIHKSSALFSSKSARHSLLEIERARLKTVSRHSSDTFSLSIR